MSEHVEVGRNTKIVVEEISNTIKIKEKWGKNSTFNFITLLKNSPFYAKIGYVALKMFCNQKGAIKMKQESNIVINQNSETGEVLMRIGIPYDDSSFKDFINIACCYNPEIEYVDGILNIKIRNIELIPSFIKIGISFYLSMNRTKYLCG